MAVQGAACLKTGRPDVVLLTEPPGFPIDAVSSAFQRLDQPHPGDGLGRARHGRGLGGLSEREAPKGAHPYQLTGSALPSS